MFDIIEYVFYYTVYSYLQLTENLFIILTPENDFLCLYPYFAQRGIYWIQIILFL